MTFGDMARSLGLEVDGHVLYTTQERRAVRPVIAVPATSWPAEWWLGRTVRFKGVTYVVAAAEGERLTFGPHTMTSKEASARVLRGSLEVR